MREDQKVPRHVLPVVLGAFGLVALVLVAGSVIAFQSNASHSQSDAVDEFRWAARKSAPIPVYWLGGSHHVAQAGYRPGFAHVLQTEPTDLETVTFFPGTSTDSDPLRPNEYIVVQKTLPDGAIVRVSSLRSEASDGLREVVAADLQPFDPDHSDS